MNVERRLDRFVAHQCQAQPPARKGRPAAPPTPRILCIDDDADFTNGLRLRLQDHGIAVLRAFSGMEGYRRALTERVDVILLDHEMPDGQGDYLLRRLRDNPITRDVPVVILTGRRDTTLKRKMLNLGASAFLNKPPVVGELVRELSRFIDVVPAPARAAASTSSGGR